MKIDSIYVNETGKITRAEVSLINPDTGSKQVYTFNRETFLDRIFKNHIRNVSLQGDDIIIRVPKGIKSNDTKNNPLNFKWKTDYTYGLPNCSIKHIEVVVEEFEKMIDAGDCYYIDIYNSVDTISLEIEGELKERLIEIGFKAEASSKVITANYTILYAIMIHNEYLRNVFNNMGLEIIKIEKDMEEIVYSSKTNWCKNITTVTKHNNYKNSIETWTNKAKLLGIYNDYIIHNNTILSGYKGNSKNPIIPPVKIIGFHSFLPSNNIKELNIPDSVKYISLNHFYKLEKVNLGKNLVSAYSGLLYDSTLKELDTGSLVRAINLPRSIERLTINTIHISEYTGNIFKNNAKIKEVIIRETR